MALKYDHIKHTSVCVLNLSLLLLCEQIADICIDRYDLIRSPGVRAESLGLIHWDKSESDSSAWLFACR